MIRETGLLAKSDKRLFILMIKVIVIQHILLRKGNQATGTFVRFLLTVFEFGKRKFTTPVA